MLAKVGEGVLEVHGKFLHQVAQMLYLGLKAFVLRMFVLETLLVNDEFVEMIPVGLVGENAF